MGTLARALSSVSGCDFRKWIHAVVARRDKSREHSLVHGGLLESVEVPGFDGGIVGGGHLGDEVSRERCGVVVGLRGGLVMAEADRHEGGGCEGLAR